MLTLSKADLEAQVLECLARVNDPELDEPLTDLGFIENVTVTDAQRVEVGFRLPTYWCSPNFAFLMAFGIRREIETLAWVKGSRVTLHDHCFGDELNLAVNDGRAFTEVFAEYCDGADLGNVIEKFQNKAFDRRQESMLLELRRQGRSADQTVTMTLAEFDLIVCGDVEAIKQKPRYRELMLSRKLAAGADDLAFPTWDGQQLTAETLPEYLGRLRSTRLNMEFNGSLCRNLATNRYKEIQIGPDGPTLVDFIAGRVPPRLDGTTHR